MEFKIDTKDTFCIITPLAGQLNAKLTGAIWGKCEEMRQSGSNNFIIDLQHCTSADEESIKELVRMHEESYGMEQSQVFTGINEQIMSMIKKDETDLLINITPRMDEAIDIISMEILERDLLGEE